MSRTPARSLFLLVLLVLAGGVWGQNRMPANPNNWLLSAYRGAQDWYGDNDKTQVIFFEVDDTVTSPLYFGVNDPGMDANDNPLIVPPNYGDMSFRVYGGTGAYSAANSRALSYTNPALARDGTLLDSLSIPSGSTAAYNNAWFYSAAILPSQGEHIGNKYIFKYVVVGGRNPDDGSTPDTADDFNNRYQVAVWTSNSGTPGTLTTVRAFAYSLSVSLEGDVSSGSNWSLYPFVPTGSSTTKYVRAHSYDGDYRAQPNATTSGFQWSLDRWDGTSYSTAGKVYVSADNFNTPGLGNAATLADAQPTAAAGYLVSSAGHTGRTWRWTLLGGGESGATEPNGVDIWAALDTGLADLAPNNTIHAGGGSALRLYSAEYTAPSADHVVLIPSTQSVASGATASVTVQIVDSTGAAVPEIRAIRIVATGGSSPVINSVDADEVVTTDSGGAAAFSVTNTGAGTVTLTPSTNGVGGSENFGGGTDVGGTVTFSATLPPTLSSASNATGTALATLALPTLTFKTNGTGVAIAATTGDLRIRIPAGLTNTVWNTGLTTPTFGGSASGKVAAVVNYVDSKTMVIDVQTALVAGDVLTIAGLAFTNASTVSSGSLELAYNGNTAPTYDVVDDKVISFSPQVFVWKGGGTTSWTTPGNWTAGVAPADTGSNIRIPNGATPYPNITAGPGADPNTISVADLEVQNGASLQISGTVSTLNVTGAFALSGTLILEGDEALTGTALPTTLGTVEFTGASATNGTGLKNFNNLTISAGTFSPTGTLSIAGNFLQTGGTVTAGSSTWSVGGNWSRSAGVFTAGTSSVAFTGSGPSTIANNTSFGTLSLSTPGKLVYFTLGTTQTMATLTIAGSPGSLVKLRSTGAGAYILTPTTATVNYADLAYCTVSSAQTANFSTNGGNNTSWTFSSTLRTWNGAGSGVDSDWSEATNWTPSGIPVAGDSVLIPSTAISPVLSAATPALKDVTIVAGATLDLGSWGLSLTGTFSNAGTLKLTGSQVLSLTNDTDSGTVELTTGGTALGGLTSFYNLTVSGATHTAVAPVVVNGNLNVAAGSLAMGAFGLSVAGTVTSTGTISGTMTRTATSISGSISSGGANLVFSNPITLTSATSITTAGGSLTFNGTVNGAYALSTNTGVGVQTFNAAVGGSVRPTSLTLDSTTGQIRVLASQSAAGNTIDYNGPFYTNASVTISETTGNVNFNDTVTVDGATLTVEAPEIDFTGGSNSVTGAGALPKLVLREYGGNGNVVLGAAADGGAQLDLTATDLAALASSLSLVTIDGTSGTLSWNGTAVLKSSTTLDDDLSITAGDLQLGTGAVALTVTGTTTVAATSVIGGAAATGTITLGAVVINDGQTLTLGAGGASPVTVGAVTGQAGGGSSSLTINVADDASLPAVSVTSVDAEIGTLTVTQSSGVTFAGPVSAASLVLNDTRNARTLAFQDTVTATSLTTAAQGYDLSLTGSSGTITNAVTFTNTGALTLGQAAGSLTFGGGLVATSSSALTVAGTIATSNDVLTLGALTLASDTTLDTAATDGTGDLTVGVVTGATHSLSLSTGHFAGANLSVASVAGVATLTVVDAGTATFSGTVGATTVAISNAATLVEFQGAVTATSLTTAAQAYALSLTGSSGTITNAVTFTNTGALTLGQAAGSLTFTGGILGVSATSGVQLAGTLATANNDLVLDDNLVLIGDTVVQSGTGALTLGGTVNSLTATNYNLTVSLTSGALTWGGAIGGVRPLGTLTLDLSSTLPVTSLSGDLVVTSGTTTLGGTTTAGANVTAPGVLAVNAQTLSATSVTGTGTVTVTTGSITSSGAFSPTTFTAGTSTVTLSGTTSVAAYSFHNLTIAGAVTASAAWTIANDVTISSGAWTAGAFTHSVGRHWVNNVGTAGLVAAGSTIEFTGAVTHNIGGSGDTNFAGLRDLVAGSTLNVTAGRTIGVSGALTLTGASGSLITLKSSVAASTWSLNNTGTNAVSYVSVSDSPATAAIAAANSLDLTGNNTNWSFGAVTWLTGGSTDANLATNWSTGVTPGPYDTATVPAGGVQPTQTGAMSLKGLTLSAAGSTWSNGGQSLSLGTGGLSNSGTFTYTGGSVNGLGTSVGGTVVYAAGAASALDPTTYNNLTVTGGTVSAVTSSVTGTFLVSGGTWTVPNGVTLTLDGASNSVTGGSLAIATGGVVAAGTNAFVVGASGTLSLSGSLSSGDFTSTGTITNAGVNTITASGNVAISNTFGGTATNGTLVMTGATATLNAAVGLGNLQINSTATGASLTGNALTLGGNLTIQASGVLSTGALGATVTGTASGAGTLTGGAGALALEGDFSLSTLTASSTSTSFGGAVVTLTNMTNNGGTVVLNRSGAQALTSNAQHVLHLTVGALSTVTPQDTLLVDGDFTLANGGAWTHNSQTLTFSTATAGTISDNNGVKVNLGAVTVSGTNKGLGTSVLLTSLTVTGALAKGPNTLTATGAVNSTGGALDLGGGGSLVVGGTLTAPSGTITNGAGVTLTFNGAGAQSANLDSTALTVGALTTSGTSALSLSGSLAADTLSVGAGTSWTVDGSSQASTLTLNGTGAAVLSINATGVFNLKAVTNAATLAFTGVTPQIANNNASGLQVTSTGAGGASISSSGGTVTLNTNALVLNGQALTVGNFSTAVAHTLSTSDALTLSGTTTFSGGLTLNGATAQIRLGANTLNATGGLTVTSGTFHFNTAGGTLNTGTAALVVNGAGGTLDLATAPTAITVGNLTVSAGTVTNTAASTVVASGDVAVTVANGSFTTPTNLTLEMTGTKTLNASTTLGHLNLSGTATVSLTTNALTLAGDLGIGASASLSTGTLGATVNGTTSGAGTLTAGSGALTLVGDFTLSSLTASSTTTSLAGSIVTFTNLTHNSGTVAFNGSSAVALTTGGVTFSGLSLTTAAKTVTVTGTLTVGGALSLATGNVLDLGSNDLSVAGATTITGTLNGGTGTDSFAALGGTGTLSATTGTTSISGDLGVTTFTHNSGTVAFVGTSSSTAGAYTYFHLTVNKTGAASFDEVAPGPSTVLGNLVLTDGVLVMSTNLLTLSGATSSLTRTGGSITSSGTIRFSGTGAQTADLAGSTLTSATLDVTKASGSLGIASTFSLGSFTTAAAAYSLSLTGTSGTITNAVTFNNTGALTLGQSGGTLTFNGGLVATANASRTLAGILRTSDDALTLGAITLAADTTLDTVASTGSGDLSVGAVTGAGFNLNLATGHVAGADISVASASGVGILTVVDAGTATVTGTVGATTVAITDAVTLVDFQGAVTATDLTVAGTAYAVTMTASTGTITNAVTFNNTGALTLGQSSGTLTFANGLNASATASHSLAGSIVTNNAALVLSKNITLTADTTLTSGSGALTAGGTIDGGFSLTLNSSATTILGGVVGASPSLTNLTTDAGGTTRISGNITATTATTFNDAVRLYADAVLTAPTITLNGTVDADVEANNRALTLNASGATTLGAAVGATAAPYTLTTNASGTSEFQAVTTVRALSVGDNTTLNGPIAVKAAGYGVAFGGTVALATGAIGISLTGSNAANDVSFTGAVTGARVLTITANGGDVSFGSTVSTSGLVVTAALTTLAATVGTDAATAAGAFSITGDLTASAALTIDTDSSASDANLSVTGAVTATAGPLTLVAGNADVTMTNAANDFGTVAITSADNASLRDGGAVILGASTIGNALTVTAGGAITQTGALAVTGPAAFKTLNNSSNGTIVLGSANSFGPLSLQTLQTDDSTLTAGQVSVSESGNTDLALIRSTDATSGVSIISTGTVTDSGNLTVAKLIVTSVGGTTLDFGNAMGSLQVTNVGGPIAISNNTMGSLTLAGLDNSGVGGTGISVSSSGDLDVTGLVLPLAGADVSLTALGATNTITTSAAVGSASGAGNVTLTADDLLLGAAVRSGSGRILLQPLTASRTIDLGTNTAGTLGLTDAELDMVTTTGALQLGSSSQAGNVSISASADVPNVTTARIETTGSIVSGAGQVFGTASKTLLRLSAGTGINAETAVSSLAAATSAGNLTVTNSRGSAATLAVTTVDGLVGLSAANQTISLTESSGAINLVRGVSTGAGTGTIHLSSAEGVTQAGTGDLTGSNLRLLGAGPVTLTNTTNAVDIVAANLTGSGSALQYTDANALDVGSVGGTVGITTNDGALTVTTDNGALTVSQAISTGAGALALVSTASTLGVNAGLSVSTGAVTLNAAGLTSVGGAGDITASGAGSVSFGNIMTGTVATAGDITTKGGAVTFYRDLDLTGGIVVDTTTGGTSTGANIHFSGAITNASAQTLGLQAGTAGNVVLAGTVGAGTPLGAITVTSANNVGGNTAASVATASINAASLSQLAGATLTHWGAVTVSNNVSLASMAAVTVAGTVSAPTGFSSSGSGAVTVAGTITTTTGPIALRSTASTIDVTAALATTSGAVTLNASGLTTLGAGGTVTATGAGTVDFGNLDSGTLLTSAGVTTKGGAVTFHRNVALGANASFDTTAAGTSVGADLQFLGTITNAAARTLGLQAGSAGNVVLAGTVGAGTALGAITITSANNVGGDTTATTATGSINAASLSQVAGSTKTHWGVVTVTGAVGLTTTAAVQVSGAVTAPSGFSSTGTTFDNTGGSINTSGGTGAISIAHSGAVTVGAGLTGATGAVGVRSTGSTLSLTAPISVTTGPVTVDASGLTTVSSAGTVTATSTASVRFGSLEAGAVETAANVTTNGGLVRYYNALTLSGDLTVASSGGAVTFSGTVDDDAVGGDDWTLTVTAGAGAVTFSSAIGATTPLAAITVTSADTLSLANVGAGSEGVTGNTTLTAATSMTFTGVVYRANQFGFTAPTYSFTGGSPTMTTSADSVTFATGALNLSAASNLTINSTGGDIQARGGIQGTSGPTVTLNAAAGGTIDVGAIGTSGTMNAVTLTGGAGISLRGNITTSGASNTVTATGPVTLVPASLTIDTSAQTGGIVFSGASSTIDGNKTLVLAAGSGPVTLGGLIGSGTQLAALSISGGTLTQSADTFVAGDITLRLSDWVLGGEVHAVGAGADLFVYSRTGAETMDIGFAGTSSLKISDAELDRIRDADVITFGLSGTQTGAITIQTALPNAAVSGSTWTFNTSGLMTLDDNGTAAAFDTGGTGPLNLNAGSIAAAQPTGSTLADGELSTTGKITLVSAAIGSSSNRVQFTPGQDEVQVTATGAVYVDGIGNLTLGAAGYSAASVTNARFDVTTQGTGDLTLLNSVSTGTGALVLDPLGSGAIHLKYSTADVLTATSGAISLDGPVVLEAATQVTTTSGNISFGSTVDGDGVVNRNLTVSAGSGNVTLSGTLGGGVSLGTLDVSGRNLSVADVGDAGTDGVASGLNTTFTASTSGSIAFIGTTYKTGGNQSWIAGTLGLPRSLTASGATTWTTPSTLTIHGNFDTTAGDATLVSNKIDLGTFGVWTGPSRTLSFSTQDPNTAMDIGFVSAGWSLDDTELLRLANAASDFAKIVWGQSASQKGTVTIQSASLASAAGGSGLSVDVFADGAGGAIVLDNTGPPLSTALDLQDGTLRLKAAGSISPAQSANANPEIRTTGRVTLDSIGSSIGTSALAPLQVAYFPATVIDIKSIPGAGTTAPGGVWIQGIGGSLTLGVVKTTGAVVASEYGGGKIYLTEDIDTGGANLTYSSATYLRPASGSLVTLTTSGGAVTFSSTLDEDDAGGVPAGTNSLTINAGLGDITFSDRVGKASKAVKNLSLTGDDITLSKGLRTAGGGSLSVTHSGVLTLSDATSAADVAGVDIDLAGGFAPTGSGTIDLAAEISTSNAPITFVRPVTLIGNVVLSSGSADLSFLSAATVGGAFGLTLNSSGTTVLDTSLGGGALVDLTSLTTDGGTATVFRGGSIVATGDLTFGDPFLIDGTTTLNANDITFSSTVNSFDATPRPLTLNTSGTTDGAGNDTTFGGAVGATNALASLTTNTDGRTLINGGSATTTGTQTYGDAVVVSTNNLTLKTTGSDISLATLDAGNRDLALDAAVGVGAFTVAGAVTNLGTATGTSFVVPSGQTGLLWFKSTVGGVSGWSLADGTNLRLDGNVTLSAGDTANDLLGNVTLDGMTLTSSRALTFGNTPATDVLTVSGGAVDVTTAAAAQPITFATKIEGGQVLTVNSGAAATTFSGVIGGTIPLGGLVTDAAGTTALNAGSVTVTASTGDVSFGDPVTINVATTINANDITFGSTLNSFDATPRSLVLNTSGTADGVGNDTTFAGTVGATNALASLTTNADGRTLINGGSVRTTGVQDYNDDVVLGTNTSVETSASLVHFFSGVTGSAGLSTLSGITVRFDGDVSLTSGTSSSVFSGPVQLRKTSPNQLLSSSGSLDFRSTVAQMDNQLLHLRTTGAAASLLFTNASSDLQVGVGGVTLSGNADFTGGTLTGYSATAAAQDITFSTAGNATTVTFPTGAALALPAYSLGRNRIAFTGNNDTAVNPKGQTIHDLTITKTAASTVLSGQLLTTTGAVIVSSGTLQLTDTQLTLPTSGQTFTVASGATLALSTTAAYNASNPAGLRFTAVAAQSFVNNGSVTLASTLGAGLTGSPIHLTATGARAVWTGNDLSWTGGDLVLTNVDYQAATLNQTNANSWLFLDDNNVRLKGLTFTGHVDTAGYPQTSAHNLTLTGSLDYAATTASWSGLTTGGASTIVFANAANADLTTNGLGSGKNLHHLNLTGAGKVTLKSSLGLTGNLTHGASAGFDFSNQTLLVRGNATFSAPIEVVGATLVLAPPASASVTLSAASLVLPDTVWAGANSSSSLTQGSAITARSLWAFGGTWNTGAFGLSTAEDLVALGAGYADYTINGVTYRPTDDGEQAATRDAATIANKLNYPYWGTRLSAFNTALNTAFGQSVFNGTIPTPGTQSAAFGVGGGQTITVGRNFYTHGASFTGAAAWNLSLPPKWTTGTSTVLSAITWTGVVLNQAPSTDWFGLPFAVAITTGAGMNVTNSTSNLPVAAAQTSVATVNLDAASVTGRWDNVRPDISAASTRFDNVVEVTFTEAMRNAANEASSAVGQTATTLDNLRFNGAAVDASAVYDFTAGTVGTAGEYALATATAGDKAVLSFRATGTVTWNTDATGTSEGGASSTNRNRTHITGVIPDLTIEKSRLYDASGNPLVNHDGLNYNGSTLSSRYTATTDKTRPVLNTVVTGQAAKAFPPTTAEDGHNYWQLTYSEPVTPQIASGAAVLGFGDSYTDDTALANQVQVTGLFRYPGTLYRSTRTAADATPQANQAVANKTSNSLNRTSAYNLLVYLTGASSGSGLSTYWDGFWWGATQPHGKVFTVSASYASQVTDAASNPTENENVTYENSKATWTISAIDPTLKTIGQTWELDRAEFAVYNDPQAPEGTYEVVPMDTNNNDLLDQVQVHIMANQELSGQKSQWSSVTGHPDTTDTTHYGIRDSSLVNFADGISLSVNDGDTWHYAGFPLDNTGPYNGNTGVDNSLFNGGPPPKVGFSISDDGYFTLNLDPAKVPNTTGDSWKPSGIYLVKYAPFLGMATNLAGRLLEPPKDADTPFKALDRTPPSIALTLTGKDLQRIYVQFTRQVSFNTADPKDALTLVGSTNRIVSVDFIDGPVTKFQQAFLNLASPFKASEIATARLKEAQAGAVSAGINVMDLNAVFPVTAVGLDLVQPVWASDGSGGEANVAGTDHVVHDFTGREYLAARDIEVQAKVFGGASLNSLPLRMYYDFNVPTSTVNRGLWLPDGLFSYFEYDDGSRVVPMTGNPDARHVDPTKVNAAGDLKNFVVPGNDAEMETGRSLEFLFQLGVLYVVRAVDPTDPRQMAPWKVPLKAIKTQKNGVTILKNVIDPTQGEKTQVLYTMARSGVVTAEIFALDGSAVKVLQRGRQAAGDYSLFWDGKNESGAIVARGVYFVRVVAPGIDETRNILVIK